jgi:hypothetical protein
MGQALRSRVVAGYVELLDGTPASPREAQALRRASQKQKRSRSTNTTPRQSAPLCNLSLPVTERPLGPPPSGLPGQPSA